MAYQIIPQAYRMQQAYTDCTVRVRFRVHDDDDAIVYPLELCPAVEQMP